jgi:hypothetical protein
MGAIYAMLILISLYHSAVAYSDPKHSQGYDACYWIGYRDGYNDAQNKVSPYECVGHSENWCSGYNDGFRAGKGGSNIFYGQSANINIHGDNNKININQQSDNQEGFTSGHKLNGGVCRIV